MALPGHPELREHPSSLSFARTALHCVYLRGLHCSTVALEVAPMVYFLTAIRTPVCPVAEILIPARHRLRAHRGRGPGRRKKDRDRDFPPGGRG